MLRDFLTKNSVKSAVNYPEYGYGQVEPNHLSGQYNGKIYAQLPADKSINILEQGQFAKYDYANGVVNFTGPGEWMLVYNEIKLYREHQMDCEFALIKDNYNARVYSPFGYGLDAAGQPTKDKDTAWDRQSRYYNGKAPASTGTPEGSYLAGQPEDVTAAPDIYEITYSEDPFHIEGPYKEAMMPTGTTMMPRLYKTDIGDHYTTNTINFQDNENLPKLGELLCVGDDGFLTEEAHAGAHAGTMRWQVVKIYTMPDHQRGVKVLRVA